MKLLRVMKYPAKAAKLWLGLSKSASRGIVAIHFTSPIRSVCLSNDCESISCRYQIASNKFKIVTLLLKNKEFKSIIAII